MVNKIQLVYVATDGLFLVMGVFILAFSIIVNNIKDEVPVNGRQAARNLLYQGFPLTGQCHFIQLAFSKVWEEKTLANEHPAGIVNAVFVFVTFVVSLPGLATSSRKWLKLSGYMAVVCGVFSMILGLYIWILTLKSRGDFEVLFGIQSDTVKSMMQREVRLPLTPPSTTYHTHLANLFEIVSMLRLPQQHLARLRHRRRMPQQGRLGHHARLRDPHLVLRQRLPRQHLHLALRHRRHRRRVCHGHRVPGQGPQGARAVPPYR